MASIDRINQIVEREGTEPIDGVFVLYYPLGESLYGDGIVTNSALAELIAERIKRGSVLCLPAGFGWKLVFVQGDPKQVTIKETCDG